MPHINRMQGILTPYELIETPYGLIEVAVEMAVSRDDKRLLKGAPDPCHSPGAMNSYFEIAKIPYEEPHLLDLIAEALSGSKSLMIEYYDSPMDMGELGEGLRNFLNIKMMWFLLELERKDQRATGGTTADSECS